MNLIAPSKRDFWRGRRVLAAMAWHLSRVLPPLKWHFERVFRRRLAAFHANVLEIVGDASRPNVTWRSVVSSEMPVGDFFLREDDAAFEVRLVNDICEGKTPAELWKGRLTGIFPFAPRNQYAMAIDLKEEPPMFKVSDTHYAKTWLLDPRAPKTEAPKNIQNLHEKMARIYADTDYER